MCSQSKMLHQVTPMYLLSPQKREETHTSVKVVGALEEGETLLEILLDNGKTFFIDKAMWEPFSDELEQHGVQVNITVAGKKVLRIMRAGGEM